MPASNSLVISLRLPIQNPRVYQCGSCGLIWATISNFSATSVLVNICPCPDCGLGSLLDDPWDRDWVEEVLNNLPEAELRRELAVYLEQYSADTTDTSGLTELSQRRCQAYLDSNRETFKRVAADVLNRHFDTQGGKGSS